jgi:uncharacterized protein (TIGR03083 family)
MNKAELLANIRAGRQQLDVSLARLSEEQWLAPALHGGWSIKDLIAHFGFWEERIVILYEQLSRGAEPAADDLALDDLNAQAYAQHQAKALDEVRREERAAYSQLVALTANASEDALFNPQRFAWTQGKPFAEWIENNTYGHYEEHAGDWAT